VDARAKSGAQLYAAVIKQPQRRLCAGLRLIVSCAGVASVTRMGHAAKIAIRRIRPVVCPEWSGSAQERELTAYQD
jgi:uncharacterized metal-binding protein